MRTARASWQAILGVAVLCLLLAVLATLQYRWITQISRAERDRRARQLEAAVRSFEEDLDQELSRLLLFLHPDFGMRPTFPRPASDEEAVLVERWNLWTSTSHHPELVGEAYLVGLEGGVVWRRLDPLDGRFETVAPPTELLTLDRRLGERLEGRTRWVPPRFLSDALTLVLPLGGGGPRRRGPSARFEALRPDGPDHLLVLRLDRKVLSDEILPELVESHFGAEFDVEVRTSPPQSALLYSTPEAELAGRKPDLRRALYLLRPFERMRFAVSPEERRGPPGAARPFAPPAPPALELLVVHRQGSLDAVVRQTRRRNLSVGLGILALLAASVLMLLVATVRARRLARQQVEFVAGLTHELHTPLAAILSASANLADGVVSSPDRVREYGRLVGEHGKRLSALVGQALELAGLEAVGPDRWEAVDLAAVVAAAREACEPLREESGVGVETEVEADLPAVRGRSDALQQVVENLLRNALRHGAAGGVARIGLRRAGTGEVELVVEDEGPGFEDADLPHVFEPFYRGRNAERSPGAGLGLRLVEQIVRRHGGTVQASNREEGGAAIVVRLPAFAGGQGD